MSTINCLNEKMFNQIKNYLILNPVRTAMQIRMFGNSKLLWSDRVPEEALPKNLIPENLVQPKGQVYDTKPFRIRLEANKKYKWCCCGHSKSQPLCDGTHSIQTLKIQIKPVLFMVEETKDYWLCNCKQTFHRPFCDGTHKSEEVKELFTRKT